MDATVSKQPRGALTTGPGLLFDSWRSSLGGGLTSQQDFASLLKAFRGWVYVCASRNAMGVASSTLRLYVAVPEEAARSDKVFPTRPLSKAQVKHLRSHPRIKHLKQVRKAVTIEEVVEHPFLDMLQQVNPFTNYFDLWELTELHQELCGNAYWFLNRDRLESPREIWLLPPNKVRIKPDKEKFLSGYLYKEGVLRERLLLPEDVIHFKFPNPSDPYYGRSPLSAVTAEYNIGEQINRYESSLFRNMGRLDGAFETEEELTDAEFERLKVEIRQAFYGVENAGKTPLLEKGVHFKGYGYNPREMSYMGGRMLTKEVICNAYGQSLGMYDKDSTRANSEMSEYTWQHNTVRPRLVRLEEKLNERLLPMYDDTLFVAFDSNVPQDRDLRLREVKGRLGSQLTVINEERAEESLPPVPWGDMPLVAQGVGPLVTGGGLPQPLPQAEQQVEAFVAAVAKGVRRRLLEDQV